MVLLIGRKFLLPIVIYFTFFPLSWQNVYGEETKNTVYSGYKYFKNYSYLEYDHHPQNLCIVQDRNGIIYVGNNGGVLISDGATWELVEVPNMLVRSLAIGKDGRIFIGGKDEFGYLAPNSRGFLEYVSLKKYFDREYGNISDVYNTIAVEDGVYFRTRSLLFRWNYKKIDLYKKGIFGALYLCNGRLLLQQSKQGLMKVENGSLTPLEGGQAFGTEKIWMLAPYNPRDKSLNFLLGTWSKGLLIYKNGTVTPFITNADRYLRENQISHGILLSNGDFAAATFYGGVVVLDPQGRVKYTFNKTRGLQDNTVNFIFEDHMGNLWLALSKGISRLEYRSPFNHYDDRSRLDGMALTVAKHKGNLYAGTMQGAYVQRPTTGQFTPIPGIGTCWKLLSTGQSLLAATVGGVFQIDKVDGVPRNVYDVQTFAMVPSTAFPGHTWCASGRGLAELTLKGNRWTVGYRYKEIDTDIRDAVEDSAGHLWLISAKGNILKVDFPFGITQPVVKRYHLEDRLYEGEIYMAVIEGHVVFASRKGLFRYDEMKDGFIPDTLLGKEFANGPGAKPVFRIAQDENRNIWFHSESRNFMAVPGSDNKFVIEGGPFRRIPIIQVNTILPEADGSSVWFAGTEGLTRYDYSIKIKWDQGFSALVRHVLVNEINPIYGGYSMGQKGRAPIPLVSYKDRNVTFGCAAPFFEREAEIIFSYRLDGFGDNWSEWTAESRKHFTNLDAGSYTFRVRAKNIYDIISREDTFAFRVLPPWYRTWWAFLIYIVGFLAGFFLLLNISVKRRSRKLVREKERLEQVVAERTREVRDKNDQLEHQTIQLQEQSEKLKEMDEIKSRFFTNISHEFRTPLTLIMSPLEQMLSRTRDEAFKKNYHLMLRNSQQLLTLINQLLDLSRLDSGKMKLQASYQDIMPLLKSALASFQIIAEQKQLTLEFLCKKTEISLYFDADKMEKVVYNLLSNAIKFTPAGGRISISLSEERSSAVAYACISVKDTGIGIPKTQLDHIFNRFFQTGQSKSQTGQGTGIGLALAKELVMLHYGKIDVQSQEGNGTEFVICLPIGKDHLTDSEITAVPGSLSQGDRAKNIDTRYMQSGEDVDEINDTTIGESQPSVSGKTVILVVEDHKDMRDHICGILEPQYSIIEAVNGKEGVAKAKEFIPDLIVSDIMMPEADGYELCRVLKKDIRTSHIPIILLTARASEKNVIRGLKTGADDYVTKPFNSEMLLARIKNLIDLRRQLQLKIQREKMLLPSELPVSNQDDRFLKEFQTIIEKNLHDEDFSIDVLCKKLLISRAALFKKIQALTGETPNQFIQSYRLERAAQLLRENFGNVTEVAMAVGFSSPQYLAKLFKERFHQSPKAYQASEAKNT